MGVDHTAYLALGVKLTENDVENLEEKFEHIDEMIWETDNEEYEHSLKLTSFGNGYGGDMERVLSIVKMSSSYGAVPFDPFAVAHLEKVRVLQSFCEEFDIECKPNWYFGLLID